MISIFRLESRKLNARTWRETSHTTSHWPSAMTMWIDATKGDASVEFRLVAEWRKQDEAPQQ